MLLLYFLYNFIVREAPHYLNACRETLRFNTQHFFVRFFCLGQLRSFGNPNVKEYESDSSYIDEDDDDADDKNKVKRQPIALDWIPSHRHWMLQEEKKSLKEKLQAVQEVTLTVQNSIGTLASLLESIKK